MSLINNALAIGAGSTVQVTSSATHLTGSDKAWTLGLLVGFILLAGLVVVLGRRVLDGPPRRTGTSPGLGKTEPSDAGSNDSTLVRSWLAISLVGGLLIFVAVSFWLDDTTLRSTLVGGVVASAGAAVAFYFASKSSDQARRDILSATLPSTAVPDLVGKDAATVHEIIASTSLRVELRPPTPGAGATVITQIPAANQPAFASSTVVATLAGPVPDLTGLTSGEARARLSGVGLELVPNPAQPAADAKVASQQPQSTGPVPSNAQIQATFG